MYPSILICKTAACVRVKQHNQDQYLSMDDDFDIDDDLLQAVDSYERSYKSQARQLWWWHMWNDVLLGLLVNPVAS